MKMRNKAKKHSSPYLQQVMEEITPLEMERTRVRMHIAARIAELINKQNWTKSQFAEAVNQNPSVITKWLSGTQNFTTDTLTEICHALGIEMEALFANEQPRVIYKSVAVIRVVADQTSAGVCFPQDYIPTSPYGHPAAFHASTTANYPSLVQSLLRH